MFVIFPKTSPHKFQPINKYERNNFDYWCLQWYTTSIKDLYCTWHVQTINTWSNRCRNSSKLNHDKNTVIDDAVKCKSLIYPPVNTGDIVMPADIHKTHEIKLFGSNKYCHFCWCIWNNSRKITDTMYVTMAMPQIHINGVTAMYVSCALTSGTWFGGGRSDGGRSWWRRCALVLDIEASSVLTCSSKLVDWYENNCNNIDIHTMT